MFVIIDYNNKSMKFETVSICNLEAGIDIGQYIGEEKEEMLGRYKQGAPTI